MAQIPKIAPTTTTATTQSSRMVAGMRNVATVDSASVEEASPTFGVPFNDTAFFSHEFSPDDFGGSARQPAGQTGGFDAPSETFVSMVEGRDGFAVKSRTGSVKGGGNFAGLVNRAIRTYEETAKVIAGNNRVLGASLSLTL